MLRFTTVCLVCVLAVFAIAWAADQPYKPVPMIKTVDPDTVRVGDDLTATGTNLQKELVASVYLIQGDKTIPVTLTSQTETELKFKVPAAAKPGRYQLMVLTAPPNPQYLEEPVWFTVEGTT